MIQADVQNAVLPESNQVVMVAVVAFASASHVRCIRRPVQVVGMRHRFLSSQETTDQCTVATVSSHKVPPIEVIVVRRAGSHMSDILLSPGDSFELALKHFNRKIQNAGILAEARRRRHYETPQARRKRKAAVSQRRRKRRI